MTSSRASPIAVVPSFNRSQQQQKMKSSPPSDLPELDPGSDLVISPDNDAKVKEAFGLPADEVILEEYSCWLARGALLKGNLYLTSKYLCFYSFIPEEPNEEVRKEGYMGKRTVVRTITKWLYESSFHFHWFVLRDSLLWIFEDSQKSSAPLGVIDLKDVKSIDPSMTSSSKFTMVWKDKVLEFNAGSFAGMLEWTKVLQSTLFQIQSEGNNIKIVAPLKDVTECSLSTFFRLSESLHLVVHSGTDHEEYFFTYFKDASLANDTISRQVQLVAGLSEPVEDQKPKSDWKWSLLSRIPIPMLHPSPSPTSPSPTPVSPTEEQQEIFTQAFKLEERLLESFPVTFSSSTRYPGTLFFTPNHLAFKPTYHSPKNASVLLDYHEVRKVKRVFPGILLRHAFVVKTFDGRVLTFDASSETVAQAASERASAMIHQAKESSSASFGLFLDNPHSPSTPASTSQSPVIPGFASEDSHILPDDGFPLPIIPEMPSAHFHGVLPETVTLLTIGSRGDVQPMIVFAKKLLSEGFKVRLAAHEEFKSWVESFGIEFRTIDGDPTVLLGLMAQHTFFSPNFIKKGYTMFQDWFDALLESSFKACLGTDCLIASPYSFVGFHIAEAMNIPLFNFCPFPWARTKAFPHPLMSYDFAPEKLNLVSYTIFDSLLWRVTSIKINNWRKKTLDLSPISIKDDSKTPAICCFDQTLVPMPSDWPDWVHTCGFFFLETQQDWTPPAKLVEFLEKGDGKVVFLGFGSIVVDDAEKLMNTLIEATRKAGVRAVISKGWSSRGERKRRSSSGGAAAMMEPPSHIYEIDSIPHSWIFPKVHAVVHHGGAGTMAAGLRASKPTIIKPFFGDQYFWGEQIEKLGAGVICKDLTVEKLAAAIVEVTTNENILQAAAAVGKKINETNAADKAYASFLRDLKLARKVVAERHALNCRNEGSAQLRNVIEKQKDEIESLAEELQRARTRISELEHEAKHNADKS